MLSTINVVAFGFPYTTKFPALWQKRMNQILRKITILYRGIVESSLFQDVIFRKLVIGYRHFGTTCWCHFQRVKQSGFFLKCFTLNMEPIGFPETSLTHSLTHYQLKERNIPEERRHNRNFSIRILKKILLFESSSQKMFDKLVICSVMLIYITEKKVLLKRVK